MGENTLRALTSDLAYLEAWSLAATGAPLPWPAPEALLLKFVAHNLWDPEKRASDPDHGMPDDAADNLRRQSFLKSTGPHAPATVRRRLANWSTLTKWRGLDGAFRSPALKSAIRLAVRAVPRTPRRKSAKAVTGDVLTKLLATCATDSLRDLRDRAILMVAFASGGRRRSEIAALRVEQLIVEAPIEWPSPPLSGHSSWPHKNGDRRAGRCRLPHGPACRGVKCVAGDRQDRQGQRVPGDRAMGHRLAAGAGSAVGQCHPEAAGGDGWVRCGGVFGTRAKIGLSHRSRQSRHSPSRGDGAIPPSIGPAGIKLLQRRDPAQWPGSPIDIASASHPCDTAPFDGNMVSDRPI
ncbi:hypothetical protein FHX15_005282 [Rhizobium sp. BK650]|nr:hypothetical protein [Rhizobium sp. BK650]